MNPLVVRREELHAPCSPAGVLAVFDTLLARGFDHDERHYRLFGSRTGRYASMSLGMPVLGGGAPVLRAWLREGAGPVVLEVNIGARLELIAFTTFWALVTIGGGGYQLFLQWREVMAGRAGWSAVTEVLPGIALLAALLATGLVLFRRRARRDAELLLSVLCASLDAAAEAELAPVTGPTRGRMLPDGS